MACPMNRRFDVGFNSQPCLRLYGSPNNNSCRFAGLAASKRHILLDLRTDTQLLFIDRVSGVYSATSSDRRL